MRTLSQVIGKLTSSLQAVLPTPLRYRHLQRLQVKGLLMGKGYETVVPRSEDCRKDLQWWIYQIATWNGRSIITPAPDLTITTDASLRCWGGGGGLSGEVHKGSLDPGGIQFPSHKCFGAEGSLFCCESLHCQSEAPPSPSENGQQDCSGLLVENGGKRSPLLLGISQGLWDYALNKYITLSAEYLSGDLSHEADWQSRNFRDSCH